MEGKGRGRLKKRWEDNTCINKEWTGIDFASSTRAAATGQGGKGLLGSYLWRPCDLARLWDRTEMCKLNELSNHEASLITDTNKV